MTKINPTIMSNPHAHPHTMRKTHAKFQNNWYKTVRGDALTRDTLCPGLEKLTNANRSVCSVSDRLFPVELTEIADWKSMSEYMLHSNFGKVLTGVIGGNFGAYTFILRLPCLLNICLSFWMFYRRKEYLNKIKILRNFRE